MHEYSLVSAMVDRIEKEAHARSAVAVHRLGVCIGALSGVEPELFASAFTLVRQGLLAEAADRCATPLAAVISNDSIPLASRGNRA